ncbi:hypothetical protein HELRODRAFT_71683, partial [Helobdella robusta]|uniref:Major facilitator superfamily (MFS) profile domain-containing protein n=1 Tax=Helobdella robusta TaxID=6412 RepID=T1G0Q2_HELRO
HTHTPKDGPFVWEKSVQGHILSSFFYGYLVSQIPGGLMAEQFGGKWVLVGSLGLSTFATLLTPVAAHIHIGLLIFVRVLCGIGSGTLYPAMHAMWGQWSPPLERSTLCGLTYAGAMMGNVIALPVSGLLCQHGFSQGWDSIFYIIGMSSTVCIIVWSLVTSNTPAQHPKMSREEKKYIIDSIKIGGGSTAKTDVIPWAKFFTSGPVWALIIANFSTDWGLYTYLTNIPTFYKEVLFFDISSNGFFSALPFLGLWAVMNIVPVIADKLQSSGVLSTVATRKIFNTIGLVGPAILLICLSFIDCTQTAVAVVLLVLAVSVSGFVFSGYLVNHMDIAPQYAGTLMGLTNGISACSGFLAPNVAAYVTKDQSRESWQIVFSIAAVVYVVGAVLYCVLASAEIQSWARDQLDPVEVDLEEKQNGNGIYKIATPIENGAMTQPMLTKYEPLKKDADNVVS